MLGQEAVASGRQKRLAAIEREWNSFKSGVSSVQRANMQRAFFQHHENVFNERAAVHQAHKTTTVVRVSKGMATERRTRWACCFAQQKLRRLGEIRRNPARLVRRMLLTAEPHEEQNRIVLFYFNGW
jgi:hypothetical protein